MKELMCALWYALYLTFNDTNYSHCDNSFYNNLGATMEDSIEGIEKANYRWMQEIREHGFSDKEIQTYRGDILKLVSEYLERALTTDECKRIDKILFANQKLRLLLFEDCNRGCPGCCNKDFDLASLPVCEDFTPYGCIMLTGGEPMLRPELIQEAIRKIRLQTNAPIILYTALAKDIQALGQILDEIDGITLTLHGPEDIPDFYAFDAGYGRKRGETKSFRLNIFVEVGEVNASPRWQVKPNIKWIENCPLPAGERFLRYESPKKA